MKINRLISIGLFLLGFQLSAQVSDFDRDIFCKPDSIANFYRGEDLVSVPILAHKLTHGLTTEIEKFRAIYTWVAHNIEGDYQLQLKTMRKLTRLRNDSIELLNWNKGINYEFFKRLRDEKKTICTGYAYLLKELANAVDIECEIVEGFSRHASSKLVDANIPNHSWNAVKIDDKWYLCDPTWSSGIFKLKNKQKVFVKEYNEGYFLSDPDFFKSTHFPVDSAWFLKMERISLEEFMSYPILYGKAYEFGLYPMKPSKFVSRISKSDTFNITLKLFESISFDQFAFELNWGKMTKLVKPSFKKHQDGIVTLSYIFDKVEKYDVHLKYKNEYIASYVVNTCRH